MATPYLSEIRIMSFNFAPKGWAQCNGQTIQVSQNRALAALLGTVYGGDGVNTFGLPNLQARVPISTNPSYPLGAASGEQTHVLTVNEEPTHLHAAMGTTTNGDSPEPSANYLGGSANVYGPLAPNATALQGATIAIAGSSQAHNNMQPYLVLNFCIALVGAYPTQN